ncbi:hypothetical protein [Paracoccus tegillarcae]|uniref:Uncharacterized protein n=1 Tax=Paracoccus tegillarcae TaxID=1529068 RepID=A0A2K9EM50_9RHOB|nr:hypothetical protein [Paracoccus tegillarcae]AUH34507.1 hypothetical protein CUV01_14935 [Paracoccus tegillarcae]
MTVFDLLIWAGAALTLLGVGLLIWCIVSVSRARRAGLDDAALKEKMRRVLAINMAALGASTIGLMAVVLGILLGN